MSLLTFEIFPLLAAGWYPDAIWGSFIGLRRPARRPDRAWRAWRCRSAAVNERISMMDAGLS
jgi:hypothetical protein